MSDPEPVYVYVRPKVTYFPLDDTLTYLKRGKRAVARRFSPHLSLLFSPKTRELIGVRVHQCRSLWLERVKQGRSGEAAYRSIAELVQETESSVPPRASKRFVRALAMGRGVPIPRDEAIFVGAALITWGRRSYIHTIIMGGHAQQGVAA